MARSLRVPVAAIGLLTVLLVAAACGADLDPLEKRVGNIEADSAELQSELASLEAAAGTIAAPVGVQHFYLTGVEWKGTTSSDDLEAPSTDPTALSNGYRFKDVGFDSSNPNNWQVASYVWTPGSMIVYEGDTVELTAFIVNGNNHHNRLVAPDGRQVGEAIDMNRGREYNISFVASQAGVYKFLCDTHGPSMSANILVLPRG